MDDLSMRPMFTRHRGERVHVVTYASVNRFVAHLALSVHQAGGILNVLGTASDTSRLPPEYDLNMSARPELDYQFAYHGAENPELDYRRILFKRLYYMWQLSQAVPADDLVLFVDGHDVLFQRPLDSLVDAWHRLTASHGRGREPVVFMGYPQCGRRFAGGQMKVAYPLPGGRSLLGAEACGRWRKERRKGTLPFVDTGGYVGRAATVRALLADAAHLAQQGLDYICMSSMHVVGLRRPRQLWVDTEASIFYSVIPRRPGESAANWTVELARPLCESGYFDDEGQPPAHSVTREVPVVLHFVGPAKWYHLNRCVEAFRQKASLAPVEKVMPCQYDVPCKDCRTAEGICAPFEGEFGFYDVDRDHHKQFPIWMVSSPF